MLSPLTFMTAMNSWSMTPYGWNVASLLCVMQREIRIRKNVRTNVMCSCWF